MAKKLDFQFLPAVTIPNAYALIGETRVNHFHQTCEIDLYVYDSEEARRAATAAPLKIITVRPPIQHYQGFIEEAANVLRAAGYALLHEVPESAAASPHGLAEMMATGENV